jgi:hypothetical protein
MKGKFDSWFVRGLWGVAGDGGDKAPEGNGSLGATQPQGVRYAGIPGIMDGLSWLLMALISDFQSCHRRFSASLVVQLQ